MRKIIKDKEYSGFTLIEMLIVLFVIAILVLIFIPNLTQQRELAAKNRDDAFEQVIESQYELYVMNEKEPPTDFSEMEVAGYLNKKQVNRATELWKTLDDFIKRKK